jgi:hypothetical protein
VLLGAGSARLDAVGCTERQTLPIPFGHHVYVVSDLALSPSTDPNSRAVQGFVRLLGDIDDAAVVVVAGNLFQPEPTSDLVKFIDATLAVLPDLREQIVAFTTNLQHRLIVLPGSDDRELRQNQEARERLERLGVSFANDLMLQVATATGVRDLAVAPGQCAIDTKRADLNDRTDAKHLEDPHALPRFVASRVLYRRLGGWVWFPAITLLVFDVLTSLNAIFYHFTRHHVRVRTPHAGSFWGNLVLNVLILAVVEAIVVCCAGLIVRRRFDRGARRAAPTELSEPLSLTLVDDVDALEFARRNAERGGAGAVVGGAPRPALAFLDRGVCAAPGPSRTVIVERRGRFGLPPVFTAVERLGVVEIEAASAVQVRLYAGETRRAHERLLEELVANTYVQPAPPSATAVVGSWPTGNPFPITLERLKEQRRQRTVRRWASGLLFLDGLVNVIVTATPPLRSRLHDVQTFFPLGVAQSAAAFTAVAGIAMIMMARGIRRGQRRAWFVACVVLSITVFAHVLRGGTFVASFIAASILTLLVVERRYFQATTDRSSARAAMPRLGLIAFASVLAASISVEVSSGRHHLPAYGVILMACI